MWLCFTNGNAIRKCTIHLIEHLYTVWGLDMGVGEQRHGLALSEGT